MAKIGLSIREPRCLLALVAVMLMLPPSVDAQDPSGSPAKPQGTVHLSGDRVVVSFTQIDDWIFINGEINGTKGRWMFDTGAKEAVALHTRKISQDNGRVVGNGFVGSGQSFEVLEYPVVDRIVVGDHRFEDVVSVPANDMSFMEPITTDLLGIVGFDMFDGYDLKIDFVRRRLTFYRQSEDGDWAHLEDEQEFVASLPYFTRTLENIPLITFESNGIEFLGSFDTGGGSGSFQITDGSFETLRSLGVIKDFHEEPSPLFDLDQFEISDDLTVDLFAHYRMHDAPFHEPLGITEEDTITFAYSFLSQFTSLWDTKNKVIYLLKVDWTDDDSR